MRLPWGQLEDIVEVFLSREEFSVLGCLSFEERCRAVPERLWSPRCQGIELLEIYDPPNAFPDYSEKTRRKIEENRRLLTLANLRFRPVVTELLADEDKLLDHLEGCRNELRRARTLILDITCLPKRFFCFILKRILLFEPFENVVVTYTQPGVNGYTAHHLAEDPMTCENLPGFAAAPPPRGDTLVVAVGFESLSIRSLLEVYRDKTKDARIILSFPADVVTIRREWSTLAEMTSGDYRSIGIDSLEVIAAWDVEAVYEALVRWNDDSENGLTLAPFGPKPHSLGMALFAMKHDCGLYYTQPKSYHPEYSNGQGTSWGYVVKWAGISCFDRHVRIA